MMAKKRRSPHKAFTTRVALVGSFSIMHMLMVIKSRTLPEIFFHMGYTNTFSHHYEFSDVQKRMNSNQKLFHIYYSQVLFLHFSDAE